MKRIQPTARLFSGTFAAAAWIMNGRSTVKKNARERMSEKASIETAARYHGSLRGRATAVAMAMAIGCVR
jgi:hypothetical protein